MKKGLKKGMSNNRLGAPHAYETWAAIYRKYENYTVEQIKKIEFTKLPVKDAAVLKMFIRSIEAKTPAFVKEIADRQDGKPVQPMEHTGQMAVDHFFSVLEEVDNETEKTKKRK